MSVYWAMMKALQQHQHIWEINTRAELQQQLLGCDAVLPVCFGDRRLSGEYMAHHVTPSTSNITHII
jgi:hypothetical protein